MEFSSKKMKDFVDDFSPIVYKYFGSNQIPDGAEKRMEEIVVEEHTRSKLMRSEITSDDLINAYKISEAVYADSQKTIEFINIYTNVQDKFIEKFVGIEGIGELYQPLFFVFEWMMHLEYLPEKDSYSYYRDHFVHQVRNMFEMFMMLGSDSKVLGIMERCVDFFETSNSVLARYVKAAVEDEEKSNKALPNLEELYNICPSDINKRETIYRYMLLSSVVVTSLIHDIGYAIQFLNKNLRRLEDFLPISGYFIDTKDKSSEIYMLLQDSLFFQTVDYSEIRKSILKGDHGTISACTLLLKYYANGKIHSMNSIQRCVIEISALTIYNHTLKYQINGEESKLYQNVFGDNPFSFWFRVCDDIEEWDRTYFDVTRQSNFLLCQDCKTIIRRMNRGEEHKQYYCCCGHKGENENLFKYRKLAHVNACDKVLLEKKDCNKVELKFEYDLMALLQASSYNAGFASKRAKGIIETKKMLFGQSGCMPVYVDAFISGNPIAIKTEIMLRYIEQYEVLNKSELDTFSDDKSFTNVADKCFELSALESFGIIKMIDDSLSEWYGSKNGSYSVVRENLIFYASMALLVRYLRKKETSKKWVDEVKNVSFYICRENKVFLNSLRDLVCDCIMQAIYYISFEQFQKDRFIYQDMYFKMQKASELDISTIESYISSELYDWVRLRCLKDCPSEVLVGSGIQEKCQESGINLEECKLDFYSDYYAFSKMNDKITGKIKDKTEKIGD